MSASVPKMCSAMRSGTSNRAMPLNG
jgi:hypothetical protein